MADFEKISMDQTLDEMLKSDFAQVIFHNIAETYPTDAHIQCSYTLTANLVPTSRDWVGLYKVGWSSSRDYVYFDWSPMPANREEGRPVEVSILFQAHNLPKDDGEFYQFCYVTSTGHVRGASTPFQFKKPSADDYVAVEDEDTDMLVIKSKTRVLEEELRKLKDEKEELSTTKDILEKERESLLNKLIEYGKRLTNEEQEKEKLKAQLQESQGEIKNLTVEAEDMNVVRESLCSKITSLTKENEEVCLKLTEKEDQISQLQEEIKSLNNEKDNLAGKNAALEAEKELFRNHFTSSESTMQAYLQEVDELKKQVLTHEEINRQQAEELDHCRGNLNEEKRKMERQMSVSQTDRVHIEDLTEKLKNTEDKLTAAEHCKKLLNDEVTNMQLAFKKMSDDLESSKSESHSLRMQNKKLQEKHHQDRHCLLEEITGLQNGLEEKSQEKEKILCEIQLLKSQMVDIEKKQKSEQEGPLYALRTAQEHLKERYATIKKQCEEKSKQIHELLDQQHSREQTRAEMEREIQDLKERLHMGAEEYKKLYIECRKLQSEVKKLTKQVAGRSSKSADQRGGSEERERSPLHSATQTVSSNKDAQTATVQQVQQAEVQTESERGSPERIGSGDYEILEGLTGSELQEQLDELGRQLEQRTAKKQRYKQMFQDEKEKNQFLQKHYMEEIKKKQEEVDKMMKRVEDFQHKEQVLQRMADEQKTEIVQLQSQVARQQTQEVTYPPQGMIKYPGPSSVTPVMPYKATTVTYPPQSPMPQPDLVTDSAAPQMPEYPMPPPLKLQFGNPYEKELQEAAADESDSGSSVDVDAALDLGLADRATLTPPLTPLPPPMMPEVLPSAKVAYVKAVNGDPMTTSTGDMQMDVVQTGKGKEPATVAAAELRTSETPVEPDTEEDRFHDADGDPQKLCPICNAVFPADLDDAQFVIHIDSHNGNQCPMCDERFDTGQEIGQREYEAHVQSHFENETR